MTKDQVREHVKKYGRRKVTITPTLVYKWWKIFNREAFGGKLPTLPDKLDMKNFYALAPKRKNQKSKRERTTYYGYCIWQKNAVKYKLTLGINPIEIYSRQLFLAVLIHEMIHAYCDMYELGPNIIHGKDFFSFRDVVESFGLPLEKDYCPLDFDKFSTQELDHAA